MVVRIKIPSFKKKVKKTIKKSKGTLVFLKKEFATFDQRRKPLIGKKFKERQFRKGFSL